MVLRFEENVFKNTVLNKKTINYVLIFCKLQSLDFKALTINAARFLELFATLRSLLGEILVLKTHDTFECARFFLNDYCYRRLSAK